MMRPGAGLSDAEINRGLAARSVDRLEAALERATLESSALARWLLGTLVAMHLTALVFIAVFAARLADETVRQGLAAFAVGALLAFLAALVSGIATFFIARMIRTATGEWMDVVANGTDSADAVAAARRLRRFANLWRAVAVLAGLVSLLLLIAGAAVIAQDVAGSAPHAESVAQPEPDAPGNSVADDVAGDDTVTEVEPAQSVLPAAPVQPRPRPAPEAVKPASAPVPPKPAPKAQAPRPAAPRPEPKPAPQPAPAKPVPVKPVPVMPAPAQSAPAQSAPAKPAPAKPAPPPATPPPAQTPPPAPQLPVIVPQIDPGSSGTGG